MLKTSRLIKEINIFLYQIFFISLFSRLRIKKNEKCNPVFRRIDPYPLRVNSSSKHKKRITYRDTLYAFSKSYNIFFISVLMIFKSEKERGKNNKIIQQLMLSRILI